MDRVTLKMVAERARVSSPTASFILNPQSNRKGCFTAATCEKVEAAAIALGYRRNGAAHSTATGRFNCVDLLLSRESVRSIVPLGLIEGVEAELAAAGQRLLISRLPDTELTDARKVPRLLQDLSSDGLLINYNSHVPPAMERLIGRFRLPAVWINSLHEADCVRPDDYAAGRDLTRPSAAARPPADRLPRIQLGRQRPHAALQLPSPLRRLPGRPGRGRPVDATHPRGRRRADGPAGPDQQRVAHGRRRARCGRRLRQERPRAGARRDGPSGRPRCAGLGDVPRRALPAV